ncbi:MAG: LPS assembly lipoprotein LptE [SAR324 cluster bacterium]|nr:LPS assembly lipoprotein LptE [SAR324 cluster bacterium]
MKKPSILSAIFYSEKAVIFLRYFLGITLGLFLAGCGYVIEGSNPVLPNEARTIALLPIQNQTFNAGLETDLSEQLNLLLRANSSVKIAPSGIADLQLNITLLNLKTSSSGLSNEQISSGVKAIIQGKAILEDRRTGRKVWEELTLEVKLTESVENETSSVSSFSLSGSVRELIKLFALKIYERLFTTF